MWRTVCRAVNPECADMSRVSHIQRVAGRSLCNHQYQYSHHFYHRNHLSLCGYIESFYCPLHHYHLHHHHCCFRAGTRVMSSCAGGTGGAPGSAPGATVAAGDCNDNDRADRPLDGCCGLKGAVTVGGCIGVLALTGFSTPSPSAFVAIIIPITKSATT